MMAIKICQTIALSFFLILPVFLPLMELPLIHLIFMIIIPAPTLLYDY